MSRLVRYLASDFLLDCQQMLRSFARRPALVAVSVLSLALGIGANAALFSVADAVLFETLPYEEPERVVRLWETFQAPGGERWTGTVSYPNLVDWRERGNLLDFGAYSYTSVNLTSGGTPERARSIQVDEEVFRILAVPAARGRVLGLEDIEGDGRSLVLSDALWRNRYGADPAVVGGTIDLAGTAYRVVGVMPADFDFPPHSEAALWQPLIPEDNARENRGSHWMNVVGRLKDGTTLEQAQGQMDAVGAQLAEEYPEQQANRGVEIRTLQETRIGDARPVIYALWAAVGFVLLIACGNVAHLLLACAAGRRQEMAVRSALGAGRSRLAMQVLAESLLLAGGGGVLGLLLGRLAVRWLSHLPGAALPDSAAISLDPRVFLYSLAVGLLAALLAGAAPAWRASRVDLRSALGTARGSVGSRDRLRGLLVVAEVALALVVTLGAALMVRSLMALTDVDSGLAGSDRVLTLRIPVPDDRYGSQPELIAAYDRMEQKVASLPGVESAGMVSLLPLQDWGWNGRMSVEGRPPLPEQDTTWVEYRVASGDYFGAMGIPRLGGRTFRPSDDSEATRVAVVNQTLARLYWGDDDPIGSRIGFGATPDRVSNWWTVVGVVGDVRNAGLERTPHPEIYVAASQTALPEMSLVVRARSEPETLIGDVRQAVLAVDPLQPIFRIRTMEQVMEEHVSGRAFDTLLLAAFAGLALLLAVVGVYSVMSHDVSLRRSEVGLRMALGADRPRVVTQFLAQGTRLAVLGAVLGGALAVAGTRLLETRLYGVEANDPATFVAGALLLVLVAAAACTLPALRAASVQPTQALRDE